MFTKETMTKAREIRKQAAQRHACALKEVYWPLCVSMAYRGETIMSNSLKRDILKPDGRIYVVEAEKKVYWNCGQKFVTYKVNGLKAHRQDDVCVLDVPEKDRPKINGKRLDGIKLAETKDDFLKFEFEAEKEYIAEQDQIQVEKYIIEDSTSNGFSVRTVPQTEKRTDTENAKKLFRTNKQETKEALKSGNYPHVSDMGDYSISEEYTVTTEQFQALLKNVEKAAEESQKAKEAKEKAEKEESLKRKQSMTDEEIVKAYFTETIKVDEDGCFSQCGDFCDDCIDVRMWKKDVDEAVRKAAETYTVSSRKGKQYFYKTVNEKSMQLFLDTQKEAINKVRQSFK